MQSSDHGSTLIGTVPAAFDHATNILMLSKTAKPKVAKFRCESCGGVGFTTHKAYLRHLREHRNHRQDSVHLTFPISCRICHKTFVRTHDLGRHNREQHTDESSSSTRRKRVRTNEDRSDSRSSACQPSASKTTDQQQRRRDLSQTLKIADIKLTEPHDHTCNGKCFLSHGSIHARCDDGPGNQSMTVSNVPRRGAQKSPGLQCSICWIRFEFSDSYKLFNHLNSHFLGFDGKHRCDICEIDFVHQNDLQKHLESAKDGNCGYKFRHVHECHGHHPPSCTGRGNLEHMDDDDRFNFCFRIRTWEQAQLETFRSTVKTLADEDPFRISTATDPFPNHRSMSTSGIFKEWGSAKNPEITLESPFTRSVPSAPDQTRPTPKLYTAEFHDPQLLFNYAALCGNTGHLKLALGKGADPNKAIFEGRTALHIAVLIDSERMVRVLLEHNADPERKDSVSRRAGLHMAAASGKKEGAKRPSGTAEKGSPIITEERQGRTPLSLAVGNGKYKLALVLLQNGARASCETLAAAIRGGCGTDFVQQLLQQGVSASPSSQFPYSPLSEACKCGERNTAELLLSHGADVNHLSGKRGLQDHALVCAARAGKVSMVSFLFDNGLDLGVQNETNCKVGEIALHAAIRHGHDAIVRLLLEKSAELLRCLLPIAGHPTSAGEEFTPLMCAAYYGRAAISEILMSKGADPLAQDEYGCTTLCWASKYRSEDWTDCVSTSRLMYDAGARWGARCGCSNGYETWCRSVGADSRLSDVDDMACS